MKDKIKEYTRLPGRGIKRGVSSLFVRTRARLYAGKDHLLCLYNAGYSEEYKRFYYKDIQAIVTCKTARGKVWNIIFSIFAAIFALSSFTLNDLWQIALLMITGIFLLFLVINWLRGPTCVSHLYTAVTKEELPALSRLKIAMKTMDRLRSTIEQTQGKLTSDEIRTKAAEIPHKSGAEIKKISPMPIVTNKKVSSYNGREHELLFYLLLVAGVQTSIAFFFNHIALTILSVLLGSATLILSIMAVVKQHSSDMRGATIGLTWTTIGYLFMSFIIDYFIFVFISFKNPTAANNQLELLKIYAQISPSDNLFLMGFYIFSIFCSFSLGTLGLILLRKFRNEKYH